MAKSRKHTKKSGAAEVTRRVEEVLRLRLDGAMYHDVMQYASEKRWGVSERQVATYLRRADDLLIERQETKRRRVIARRLAQRESLFARAVQAADYRTALAVLADMDRLQGHYLSDRDIKDVLRLAAVQGERIRELESRLDAAVRPQGPVQPPGSPA
jgi:hypothetical protein